MEKKFKNNNKKNGDNPFFYYLVSVIILLMSRSKIGSTLSIKRKKTLLRKVFFIIVIVLFLVSLSILSLTNKKIRIKENIIITGNSAVSSEDVFRVVEKELNTRYFSLIPTDNFLFLRRKTIRESIYDNFKKIKEIKINLDSLTNLNINIEERSSDSLWCDGLPEKYKDCYFMDKDGFVFAKAPDLTDTIFMRFFGLIKDEPIGKQYFNKEKFLEKKEIIYWIKKIGFSPKYFVSLSENDFEIILSGGAKVCFDETNSIIENINKIEVLIKEGLIKIDKEFVDTIKHIDLRYGNKVHYDFK